MKKKVSMKFVDLSWFWKMKQHNPMGVTLLTNLFFQYRTYYTLLCSFPHGDWWQRYGDYNQVF